MFDLGFMEMLVIGIIGLLVLGPERLPVAVRTSGWLSGVSSVASPMSRRRSSGRSAPTRFASSCITKRS